MDDQGLLSSADEVRAAVFNRPKMGRRGYNVDEVDALLDKVAARMEGRNNLTVVEVSGARFGKPPIGQRGYREDEVDQLLDRIIRTLEVMGPPRPPVVAPEPSGSLSGADVRDAKFNPPARRREGYHEGEVDDFLDAVMARLDTGRGLSAAEVRSAQFRRPRLGRLGYAAVEVDALLQRAAEAIEAQEKR